MHRSSTRTLLAFLLVAGVGLGPAAGALDAQQKNVLAARKVAAPPALDGSMEDLWKGVRTNPVGQIDDQYTDHTRYDKEKSPNAGRHGDPKTGGGYVNNETPDKQGPRFALKGNKPAPPYWILDAEKEPFDDSKYKAGDEVPGIVIAPFAGDRGDIAARGAWKDGTWTVEIARKLVTGSEFDVQFKDLRKAYAFGVSVFDNAQVRHAYSPGVLKLTFE